MKITVFTSVLLGWAALAGNAVNGIELAPAPMPVKQGMTFMVDNFDFKTTRNDTGFNFFNGNMGEINNPAAAAEERSIITSAWPRISCGSTGASWKIGFDFGGFPAESFGGVFVSLFGLTDTKIDLTGAGEEPAASTAFPGHYLDFDNLFGAFKPWKNRSIDSLAFHACLAKDSPPLTLRVELKDDDGRTIFTRRDLESPSWASLTFGRASFSRGDTGTFRWDRVKLLSLIVERNHVGDLVHNPTRGAFLVDNIRLIDADGSYPDLQAMRDPQTGGLRADCRYAFLDYLRRLSFLYFLDSASTDPRTGGLIQDRGTFADLLTVGGAGFQLSAYIIGAERGYLSRTSAAARVNALLAVLESHPQGAARVGVAGHRGFFYHFLGIDGLRKQNFDFTATAADESLNTVELSSIDTALALMGVITARRYFLEDNPVEQAIRESADRIVDRVQWPFMLADLPDGKKQVYLGWKPSEERSDSPGRFLLPDGLGTGFYSSKPASNGVEVPATLDYYTDEGLIVALLGMAAPDPANRLPRETWYDLTRKGAGFVKTYPGALFTYQFMSCWLDTKALGPDNHASRPLNFFDNTRTAILGTRDYAIARETLYAGLGPDAWALSACEGPFDDYGAEGAPTAALAKYSEIITTIGSRVLEGEAAAGSGTISARGNASGLQSRLLKKPGSIQWPLVMKADTFAALSMDYSNDGPSDTLAVFLDGVRLGRFATVSTGTGGAGWNQFESLSITNRLLIPTGAHTVRVTVVSSDLDGAEVDALRMAVTGIKRPLATGTLAPYAAGSSIVHAPDKAVESLWHMANLDLNGDGVPDLLHPRFGFADAYNEQIAGSVAVPRDGNVLRKTGAWANPTGFAIDQGPLLLLLDNDLGGQFVPQVFMSDTNIQRALKSVFESFESP